MAKVVPYSALLKDLTAANITPADTVMIHLSLKSIGWIVGGGDTLLKALLDILLPEGTLCMMVGWEDYPYELPKWEEDRQQAYLQECPAFDPASSRANIWEFGILAEYIRTLPGDVHRSKHPTASFVAIGKHAARITADHSLQYGFGLQSPLHHIHTLKGKILHIGCPFDTVTMLHYAEDRCAVANKRTVRYQMPILEHGHRRWVELEEFDTSEGIVAWQGEDYFQLIIDTYIQDRQLHVHTIGQARTYVFDSQDLVTFATEWMEQHFRQ